jgi:hypothetical protein
MSNGSEGKGNQVSIELIKSSLISERRSIRLHEVVGKLKSAIASGMVPNVLFKDAKDVINRAVEEGSEAFLKTGPHIVGRNGEAHHQSDWWLVAYDHDAFVRGATGIPTALKRAQKAGLTEYAAFLTGLLPLHEMLQSAKPLIRKKGELPKVKSAKQIEEEADRMTCQCCERQIFAKLGSIAHHGYERPGYGWQTASCMGAKRLPFEVDRAALGEMIQFMRDRLARAEKHRAAIKAEKLPIVFEYERQLIGPQRGQQFGYWIKWPVVKHSFNVSRESFEEFKAGPGSDSCYSIYDFDAYKARHVEYLSGQIKNLRAHINEEQARYDGWKQTHEWKGGQWAAV